MPCERGYPQSKRTGERLSQDRMTCLWRFLSIAYFGGGLRRFRSGAEIRRFDGSETGSTERAQAVFSWAVGRSGWICEAEQFFLRLPAQWELAATGREKLRGEFRWLAAFGNSFDDRGREKSQANHATDVTLADTLALAKLDHRSRAPRHQIVKPAAGSCRRLQDRRIDPRR